MKTAVIISEYNPFHTGHEYQIEKIREDLGADTAVVSIMSGNFVQRGDVAVMDKHERARLAVLSGVDLVLELPFPYSMGSAEFFASAGVSIANAIGVADHLSFGSECGDAERLRAVAKNTLSPEYNAELARMIDAHTNDSTGYPALCELAYKSIFGEDLGIDFSPNNILAIEYLKALILSESPIMPHTVKRLGSDHKAVDISEATHQSATAIRSLIFENYNSAAEFIPYSAKSAFFEAFDLGEAPCDAEKLSSAIISYFRLNPYAPCEAHDAGGGLYNRLHKASLEATTISSLTELAMTKKFTAARVRRAMWFSYFGITSSDIRKLPRYTQVLAMNDVGKSILKQIKKVSDFPVLTKPSFSDFGDEETLKQKMRADRADMIFQLTKPIPHPAAFALTSTPFIK